MNCVLRESKMNQWERSDRVQTKQSKKILQAMSIVCVSSSSYRRLKNHRTLSKIALSTIALSTIAKSMHSTFSSHSMIASQTSSTMFTRFKKLLAKRFMLSRYLSTKIWMQQCLKWANASEQISENVRKSWEQKWDEQR